MKRPAALALLCLLIGSALADAPRTAAAPTADALRKVTVDAAATIGTLRSLAGVNGAPAPGMHKPENFRFGGWNMPDQVDASPGYRAAQIDLVRTHDAYGPADIDSKFETNAAPGGALISAARDVLTIFPDPGADPNNPDSYRFGPTDKLITSIRSLGAQVIFRLGRSEGADAQPPPDFDHYASVAKHIVLHYNRGWAHGFRYGIRYWEIWNEPDLGKVFWAGTPQQYYDLYTRMARAVKQADPTALVGGPAIARPNDDSPYIDGFLQYLHKYRIPLDFYSWHWYATDSEDPLDFVRIGGHLRAVLDRGGFKNTQSFLTEWNSGLGDVPPPPLIRASFITSALIYMQDAPIDASTLYRADSVFGPDGASPDKTGQALIAIGRLKSTPLRLKTTGADEKGFAVEAGRSRDGGTVQVLISNYQIPAKLLGPRATDDILHVPPVFDVRLLPRRSLSYADNAGFELTIDHLPPGKPYIVERCLISGSERLMAQPAADRPGRGVVGPAGRVVVRETLPPPAIELITVRPVAQKPPAASVPGLFCTAQSPQQLLK